MTTFIRSITYGSRHDKDGSQDAPFTEESGHYTTNFQTSLEAGNMRGRCTRIRILQACPLARVSFIEK